MRVRTPWWATLGRPFHSVVVPLLLVAVILTADHLEGPKTAYVGVLVAVPMLSAVFGSPVTVVLTGGAALVAAWLFGLQADDGQVAAQVARLAVIAALTAFAAAVATQRLRYERRLARADQVVAAVTAAIIRPLPARVGGLGVAARYLGADAEADVGGDFYEVVDTPYGVRVVVGDVRGKGLDAVRLANYVLGAFRDAARREPDLAEVVRALEGIVAVEGGAEDFVTAVLLEVGEHEVRGLTCGHPQPQLLTTTGAVEAALPVDVPLGLGAGAVAPTGLGVTPAAPLRALLLHSDGLTEARSRDGEFLDLTAALRPTSALPGEVLLDALLAAVRGHVSGRLRDDVAVLWLELPGARGRRGRAAGDGHPAREPVGVVAGGPPRPRRAASPPPA